MRVQFTVRHDNVGDDVRQYAEEKLTKLERRLHELRVVDDQHGSPTWSRDLVATTLEAAWREEYGYSGALGSLERATQRAHAQFLQDEVAGNRINAPKKEVTVETGAKVQVPIFIFLMIKR